MSCPRVVISFQARRFMTMCAIKGLDGMPCKTSSDLCVAQMRRWNETPDIVRPCVLLKGHVGIQRFMSSNSMSSPRAIMACHSRRRSSVCVVQRDADMLHPTSYKLLRCPRAMRHATPNVVRLCVLQKVYDGSTRPSSVRVCSPKALMACHVNIIR